MKLRINRDKYLKFGNFFWFVPLKLKIKPIEGIMMKNKSRKK
jgi:hypothetical protein